MLFGHVPFKIAKKKRIKKYIYIYCTIYIPLYSNGTPTYLKKYHGKCPNHGIMSKKHSGTLFLY